MELIGKDVAEKIWCDFLDEKDVLSAFMPKENIDQLQGDSLKEEQGKKQNFDKIVKAIQKGVIDINEGVITQKLKYPIKTESGKVEVSELEFSHRWTAADREQVFSKVDSKDPSQSLLAQRRLLAILTNVDLTILRKVDVDDLKITDVLVSVFLM